MSPSKPVSKPRLLLQLHAAFKPKGTRPEVTSMGSEGSDILERGRPGSGTPGSHPGSALALTARVSLVTLFLWFCPPDRYSLWGEPKF